jgi:hypothetical protein
VDKSRRAHHGAQMRGVQSAGGNRYRHRELLLTLWASPAGIDRGGWHLERDLVEGFEVGVCRVVFRPAGGKHYQSTILRGQRGESG